MCLHFFVDEDTTFSRLQKSERKLCLHFFANERKLCLHFFANERKLCLHFFVDDNPVSYFFVDEKQTKKRKEKWIILD